MKLIYMTIAISVSLCILMSPCTGSPGRTGKTTPATTPTTPTPETCDTMAGFIWEATSKQCFKLEVSHTEINWDQATTLCKKKNMTMAHPQNPIRLGRDLVSNSPVTGVVTNAWLNCKWVSTVYVWQDDKNILTAESIYWRKPHKADGNGRCVVMNQLAENEDTPYATEYCSVAIYQVLCQKKTEESTSSPLASHYTPPFPIHAAPHPIASHLTYSGLPIPSVHYGPQEYKIRPSYSVDN